jgi:predicted N-acyltransferase
LRRVFFKRKSIRRTERCGAGLTFFIWLAARFSEADWDAFCVLSGYRCAQMGHALFTRKPLLFWERRWANWILLMMGAMTGYANCWRAQFARGQRALWPLLGPNRTHTGTAVPAFELCYYQAIDAA